MLSSFTLYRLSAMFKLCLRCAPWLFAGTLIAQTSPSPQQEEPRLLTVEGVVEVFPVNGTSWVAAKPEQLLQYGDRVRTGVRSRATARLRDLTVLRINELTTFQLRPPAQAGRGSVPDLHSGSSYFFSR